MSDDPRARPLECVLFPREVVAARVKALAAEIAETCRKERAEELTLVAVADGALVFAADLMRELSVPVRFVSVRVSAYGDGVTPGERAEIVGPIPELAGEHTLVVEDILDSGLTLNALRVRLRERNPASLRSVVLLDKPSGRKTPFTPDFTGFTCPDAFVVGYGMDFAGRYRNLPDIGVLRKELRP